ncbi:NAD+ kinase [Agromyces terreus]|uniref:NAD kinase n=1 Tax=Agromyces terreus TaxID=424795 RepID=A0A9X2KBQ8_9MICO|nr:NAD+ kinase [Agromyces terreus]
MNEARHFLVVSHTGRHTALEATGEVCAQLIAAGAVPVIADEQWNDVHDFVPELNGAVRRLEETDPELIELVIVLGGDGTILRAAELVREHPIALLGVNLGHVGFLAESERDDLGYTVQRALARDYTVEERMTLSVRAKIGEQIVYESWALNEVSVEKAERERMIEVVIEVDRRPLSSFGCDGVVMSTPTGSTAYAFSAGGPIVWPGLEALLLVPLSAHALFARPLVVAAESSLAVEVLQRTETSAVIWCDGRRTFDLPAGARVVVRRSPVPVRLARLHEAPFTDRLVNKFELPVSGWRGPVGRD